MKKKKLTHNGSDESWFVGNMTLLRRQLHRVFNISPQHLTRSQTYRRLTFSVATMASKKDFIQVADDGLNSRKLAYVRVTPNLNVERRPTVVFFHGLFSSMTGGKAVMLERLAHQLDFPFVRFDFTACGGWRNQYWQLNRIFHVKFRINGRGYFRWIDWRSSKCVNDGMEKRCAGHHWSIDGG